MYWLLILLTVATFGTAGADPLPSWRDGAARQAITTFVTEVTDPSGPNFVPPAERIAVFDNDGTLWVEQPMYTQLAFVLDRLRALAPDHPEWQEQQPFKAALAGDLTTLAQSGMPGLLELLAATHAGMSADEFEGLVEEWIGAARHPRFDRAYTQVVYQPMLELLAYLRANGFKTFIVSGGGADFMRPWAESVYGIPREQVIGSLIRQELEVQEGRATIVRRPEVAFVDDKAGKPVAIQWHVGRRPILAVGNSDGDLEMLQWTTTGTGRRLGVLLHHTDAEREYAYDRQSHFGRLDKALDLAPGAGWVVISMEDDWATVFPPSN
jgi:phosphoserine phosphatase